MLLFTTKLVDLVMFSMLYDSYGTGAIMAVPAHDTRDHEFALKYNIPVSGVVTPENGSFSYLEKAYTSEGTMINSSSPTSGLDINGLPNKDAASKVIEWLEKTGCGMKKVLFLSSKFGQCL